MENEEKVNEAVSTEEEKDVKKKKSEEKSDKTKKLKNEIVALEKELEEAKAKATESEDKYLRVAAEYDNFRKRNQKEKEGIYSDAKADAVIQLLPIIDNLQRATQYTDAEKVAEGLDMILKTIPDVLVKMGIEEFGEVGDKFDPNLHNAMMHSEDESFGENEIANVFQKGYKIGDKIIRYAMVVVAN